MKKLLIAIALLLFTSCTTTCEYTQEETWHNLKVDDVIVFDSNSKVCTGVVKQFIDRFELIRVEAVSCYLNSESRYHVGTKLIKIHQVLRLESNYDL